MQTNITSPRFFRVDNVKAEIEKSLEITANADFNENILDKLLMFLDIVFALETPQYISKADLETVMKDASREAYGTSQSTALGPAAIKFLAAVEESQKKDIRSARTSLSPDVFKKLASLSEPARVMILGAGNMQQSKNAELEWLIEHLGDFKKLGINSLIAQMPIPYRDRPGFAFMKEAYEAKVEEAIDEFSAGDDSLEPSYFLKYENIIDDFPWLKLSEKEALKYAPEGSDDEFDQEAFDKDESINASEPTSKRFIKSIIDDGLDIFVNGDYSTNLKKLYSQKIDTSLWQEQIPRLKKKCQELGIKYISPIAEWQDYAAHDAYIILTEGLGCKLNRLEAIIENAPEESFDDNDFTKDIDFETKDESYSPFADDEDPSTKLKLLKELKNKLEKMLEVAVIRLEAICDKINNLDANPLQVIRPALKTKPGKVLFFTDLNNADKTLVDLLTSDLSEERIPFLSVLLENKDSYDAQMFHFNEDLGDIESDEEEEDIFDAEPNTEDEAALKLKL